MSKFKILRSPKHHLLNFHRVSPLWRQGFNRGNQMYISSQVKSALRKLRDWEKARIVTVYYSCEMYLYCTSLVLHIWLNGPRYLLNSNALTRLLGLQTTEWENVNYVSGTCLRETFLLMKLNCFTNIKTCLSSCKKSINHIRDVEAEVEAGSGSSGSGPFCVEAEAWKSYRFRFHIGYLTWRVTWRKSFHHFPMWI